MLRDGQRYLFWYVLTVCPPVSQIWKLARSLNAASLDENWGRKEKRNWESNCWVFSKRRWRPSCLNPIDFVALYWHLYLCAVLFCFKGHHNDRVKGTKGGSGVSGGDSTVREAKRRSRKPSLSRTGTSVAGRAWMIACYPREKGLQHARGLY